MDYDHYIQELTSDSVPQDRAERVIAEAVWAYMNRLADNACGLYEQRLKQRCQDQGQVYSANRQPRENFPLELFTKNIKTNKLDAAKWNATIQGYLASHMPEGMSPPDPNEEQDILNCLRVADQQINAAFPDEKNQGTSSHRHDDKLPDHELFAPAIPFIYYVASAAAMAVMTTAGLTLSTHLRRKRGPENIPRIPFDWDSSQGPGDSRVVIVGPWTGTGGSEGHPPSPPPPAPIPDTIPDRRRKRERREKKKRRQGDKDKRRKDRKDYYFGYVDRVEPAGAGYEIRVEAIVENSLSDEVFMRELEKLAVAAGGNPGFGRYRLALISIYVHSVPPAVEVGKWINFKVETKNRTPATTDSPDVSGAFTDGVSLLEALEPRFSFVNMRIECYFANDDGFIVQTDVNTITRDITASAFAILQAAFSTFNFVTEAIKNLLDMFMNKDKKEDEEPSDSGVHPAHPVSVRDLVADNMLARLKKPRKPIKVKEVVPERCERCPNQDSPLSFRKAGNKVQRL